MILFRPRSYAMVVPENGLLHVTGLRKHARGFSTTHRTVLRLQSNLLGDTPEIVARELKDRLVEAVFRERHCILAVPPDQLLQQTVIVPDLPADDEDEYLWLQAEKAFPTPVDQCVMAVSRFVGDDGQQMATLFVLNRDRFDRLRDVFARAGLRVSAVVPAFLNTSGSGVTAGLSVGTHGVRLQVANGTGIVLLRDLAVQVSAPSESTVAQLRRQVRIALATIPESVRTELKAIGLNWDGTPDRPTRLAEIWNRTRDSENGMAIIPATPDTDSSPGEAEFAAHVAVCPDASTGFRPKTAPEKTRGPAAYAGRIAVPALILLGILAGTVGRQGYRLRDLKGHMTEIQPALTAVEQARDTVRAVAPWFGRNPVTLEILKAITDAFPERGTVWLTRLSIGSDHGVEFTGKATDPKAWLTMQTDLRRTPLVRDVRVVSQTRADSSRSGALAFTISFIWQGGKQI